VQIQLEKLSYEEFVGMLLELSFAFWKISFKKCNNWEGSSHLGDPHNHNSFIFV